jgi:dolichol-phosphate mannosyltransferase
VSATASDDTDVRAMVCLPTYNERENLEPMLRALGEVLAMGDRVLVIDDASPDGTGAIADRLAAELGFVDVLHRPRKEGLGPAYLAGFRRALDAGAELVLEMDCDFSHDPKDVPRLLAAARDADLVLGSRYVPGGGVENWGLVRRAVSAGGSLYARLLLGVPVRDLTGGFKCFRRSVLESIDLDQVRSKGYAFQIELTYRALRQGFDVREVPIRFADREVGGSKMSRSIVLEAIWKVPLLRLAALRAEL